MYDNVCSNFLLIVTLLYSLLTFLQVWSMFNLSTTTDFIPLYRLTELHSFDISAIVVFEFLLLSNNYDSTEVQEKSANDIFIATAGNHICIHSYV